MKIWYDACTGKHVRYGTAIAKALRQQGHQVILTTREHPDTLALAKTLNEEFIPVGKYEPATLFTRLDASMRRILKLAEMFKNSIPDVAISHQSVELCRVAFGLNIPIILTADTPHATAVNRLTLPFASTLVVSEAMPRQFLKNYCAQDVVQFKGVDEVAWIKNLKPSKISDLRKPLIVVRQMETKAAYALGEADLTADIAKKLGVLGNVLFIQRYSALGKEGVPIKKEIVDSASLVAHADLVVTVGGTIAREAALQGIPSLVISKLGRTPVNTYLARKGFPLFIINPREVLSYAKKYIGKRFDVKTKLALLENPVDIIQRVVAESQNTSQTLQK
jgi:predicted glycosyltransferase